jgi:hypothetical protein
VLSRATVVTVAVIVIPWPGDSRDRRSGRAAPLVSGGLAPGSRVITTPAGSSAAGSAPAGPGGTLTAQGGVLAGQGGGLPVQGDPSGSRDGWRADQEGSAGGSSKDQGETGGLTGCEVAGAACGSHPEGGSSSGAT